MTRELVLPPEPLFVDRDAELAEFDAFLHDLEGGLRRHLALFGLRRIGKTVLLDEVRRRHPTAAIAYLALDEVVTTPEDFARALAGEVLRALAHARGKRRDLLPVGAGDASLRALAAPLGADAVTALEPLLATLQPAVGAAADPDEHGQMQATAAYGPLLVATMRFPGAVAEALGIPLVIMLDEFQEVTRLHAFPGTENLLGTLRAALDRPGRIAYVVAGSRVSALRTLLGGSENPLFTRFESLELRPFPPDATHELATLLWDEPGRSSEPDASVRLHRLTGGWPFYAQTVAARARQLARTASQPVTDGMVDVAFEQELIGRAAALGQYCRYLLDTALRIGTGSLRNTLEAVLRQTARHQPVPRTSVERRLRRHHAHTSIHTAINRLIDNDFLHEDAGLLSFADPVFALWLNLEEVRRDPDAALRHPAALRRLLASYETQHQHDRTEIGALFERRIENLVRQFRGQTVSGALFGLEGTVQLPTVRDAGPVRLDDPNGRYGTDEGAGAGPDQYELDIVTTGDGSDDLWAIEAKHRRGAITAAMVTRFVRSAHAVEQARGVRFARLWLVAPRGVRPDAAALTREHGLLSSGLRQLNRLEREVVGPHDVLSRQS